MDAQTWNALIPEQRAALFIAMHVRNAMEDFHVKHLSDKQMKELNKTIRQAIFDSLMLLKGSTEYKERRKRHKSVETVWERLERAVDWQIKMIPEYWEVPTVADFEARMKKEFSEIERRFKGTAQSR